MTRGRISALAKFLASLAIVATGTTCEAVAQRSAVESCAAIDEDSARLACYDDIFRSTDIPANGAIVVESERLIPARPTGREPAVMTISCIDGAMNASFGFAGQLVSNSGDVAPLTYQVDSGGTVARTLQANEDNTQLSFASAQDTRFFLDSLVGGTNLKVRMTPVRQRSVTVDFRLPAVADDIAAMRASCG